MAKTFDEVVYSLCKKYTNQSQLGFKSVKQVANGFEIEYVNGTKATYTVQDMHKHTNMAILNVLNKDADGNLTFNGKKITNLTADQEQLLMKFSLSADNKLLFDGKPIEGGGSGEAYDDTEVRGLIDTNKANIATNTSDISDLTTKIGTTAMGTTATDVTGAVAEVNGNQLDTVSFSSDYKNIVLNRKNGLNPYSIPIAAIINHAKLVELGDIDTADIGNGKTLIYDATTQTHKYVESKGTDELVKMDAASDAHYLADLLDKQTIVNDNGVLKVKKLDGQEVTIAEINHLKGLTMNVMDLVNSFANGGVKVLNTPVATYADLSTLDRSTFIDGISYIVYVLADESHAGAKTTYLCTKTNTTYFGNADSQRNFTTDPINLANEVTGKLGTSNIDIDSLWKLLTINDTYKTLTTKDEVFGTHGAKKLYDELTTAIGAKANDADLTTHTSDTDIHITTTERTKWNEVVNKANKTEVLLQDDVIVNKALATNSNVLTAKVVVDELDKKANDDDVVKKTDIKTTIDSTSTDDTVPSTKAVFTPINNIQENLTSLPSIDDLNNFKGKSFMIGRGTEYNNTTANFPNGVTGAFVVEYLPYYDGENYGVQRLTMVQPINSEYVTFERSLDNGNWMGWQRLCSTSVADVPFTKLTLDTSVFDTTKYSDANISYIVRNGMCAITCKGVGLVSAGTYVVASNILKPAGGYATNMLQVKSDAMVPTNPVFLTVYNNRLTLFSEGSTGPFWGTLTYPVAEE